MPDLRSQLRHFLLRRGWFLRRTAGLPPGVCLELDWHDRLGLPPPQFIVDVGAHRGESVERFSAAFPVATIFAFEPVAENFRVLAATCQTRRNVTCLPLAISDHIGEVDIELQANSQTHSLEQRSSAAPSCDVRRERLRVTTLDASAASHAWTEIGLLKIDTEGHELAVLRGARGLFEQSRIRTIFVEATLDPHDAAHTPLSSLCDFLHAHGFRLAALYDQALTAPGGSLAYLNALFVSDAPPRNGR